jgi:hypothetical protein
MKKFKVQIERPGGGLIHGVLWAGSKADAQELLHLPAGYKIHKFEEVELNHAVFYDLEFEKYLAGGKQLVALSGIMARPTCHSNGTSPADLRTDYLEARRAVELAKEALKKCHPNGRDYYPQDGGCGVAALKAAQDQHWDRMRRLNGVAEELMALAEHVDQFCKD